MNKFIIDITTSGVLIVSWFIVLFSIFNDYIGCEMREGEADIDVDESKYNILFAYDKAIWFCPHNDEL